MVKLKWTGSGHSQPWQFRSRNLPSASVALLLMAANSSNELEIMTHTVPRQEMHMWSVRISHFVLVFPQDWEGFVFFSH